MKQVLFLFRIESIIIIKLNIFYGNLKQKCFSFISLRMYLIVNIMMNDIFMWFKMVVNIWDCLQCLSVMVSMFSMIIIMILMLNFWLVIVLKIYFMIIFFIKKKINNIIISELQDIYRNYKMYIYFLEILIL